MIQFPADVWAEWQLVADAANAELELRKKIARDTLVERELERLRIRYQAELTFQQELSAEETPVLEMGTLADYQTGPAPVDLIEGVMKDNGLCTLLGPSSSGKSTLALQMVHSLATGADWLGQQVRQISGGIGVMSYDMDGSMMVDWMSGFPGFDPAKVSVVNAYRRGNPLGTPAMRAQIIAAWKALGVEVIVIDSFSASFFGSDQNDAAATMAHYRNLRLFALTEVGARAMITITHSTEKAGQRARGSSVHHDVADSIVSIEANERGERVVRMVKYRAARGQQQMSPVIVTAPDAVTHLVELDPGAMNLQGLPLPPKLAAMAFTTLPDANEVADIQSDDEDDYED